MTLFMTRRECSLVTMSVHDVLHDMSRTPMTRLVTRVEGHTFWGKSRILANRWNLRWKPVTHFMNRLVTRVTEVHGMS